MKLTISGIEYKILKQVENAYVYDCEIDENGDITEALTDSSFNDYYATGREFWEVETDDAIEYYTVRNDASLLEDNTYTFEELKAYLTNAK
jgi:hypothetical protein